MVCPSSDVILKDQHCKINNHALPELSVDNSSICEDENVEKLMSKWPVAEFVITNGAVKSIVVDKQENWIIPLKVKKINEKWVFIIDSPLVKNSNHTALEKAQMAIQASTKDFVIRPWESKKRELKQYYVKDPPAAPSRGPVPVIDDVDSFFSTDFDDSALDTFGAISK